MCECEYSSLIDSFLKPLRNQTCLSVFQALVWFLIFPLSRVTKTCLAQLTTGISIQSEVLGHMGAVLFIHKPQIPSLHRMPPLLLRLTPPYELWLPYNALSKCDNIHLFPFPCTPISTLLSLVIFRVKCVFCA